MKVNFKLSKLLFSENLFNSFSSNRVEFSRRSRRWKIESQNSGQEITFETPEIHCARFVVVAVIVVVVIVVNVFCLFCCYCFCYCCHYCCC